MPVFFLYPCSYCESKCVSVLKSPPLLRNASARIHTYTFFTLHRVALKYQVCVRAPPVYLCSVSPKMNVQALQQVSERSLASLLWGKARVTLSKCTRSALRRLQTKARSHLFCAAATGRGDELYGDAKYSKCKDYAGHLFISSCRCFYFHFSWATDLFLNIWVFIFCCCYNYGHFPTVG